LAADGDQSVGSLDQGARFMICINQIWLATEPLDMRVGADTALACIVKRFGKAQPHTAYVFLNKRANRMKVLVHDGFGVWLAARRLQRTKPLSR